MLNQPIQLLTGEGRGAEGGGIKGKGVGWMGKREDPVNLQTILSLQGKALKSKKKLKLD